MSDVSLLFEEQTPQLMCDATALMGDAHMTGELIAGSVRESELDRALGELAKDDRAAILLIGLAGLSDAEAAAVLRVPECSLDSRLSRARAELRQLMGAADTHRRRHPAHRKMRHAHAPAHRTRRAA